MLLLKYQLLWVKNNSVIINSLPSQNLLLLKYKPRLMRIKVLFGDVLSIIKHPRIKYIKTQ
jgi:hypothetical protein